MNENNNYIIKGVFESYTDTKFGKIITVREFDTGRYFKMNYAGALPNISTHVQAEGEIRFAKRKYAETDMWELSLNCETLKPIENPVVIKEPPPPPSLDELMRKGGLL